MPKKEMTVEESIRMTKTPYRSKANKVDYGADALTAFPGANEFTYMGEGAAENKAGAGRGKQGGPTAEQARQNRGMMSDAEKAAREEMDFEKISRYRPEQGYKKGGSVSSASSRADGIAQRGKTKGTIVMCGGGMYKK